MAWRAFFNRPYRGFGQIHPKLGDHGVLEFHDGERGQPRVRAPHMVLKVSVNTCLCVFVLA